MPRIRKTTRTTVTSAPRRVVRTTKVKKTVVWVKPARKRAAVKRTLVVAPVAPKPRRVRTLRTAKTGESVVVDTSLRKAPNYRRRGYGPRGNPGPGPYMPGMFRSGATGGWRGGGVSRSSDPWRGRAERWRAVADGVPTELPEFAERRPTAQKKTRATKKSDDRIHDAVVEKLHGDALVDATGLTVGVRDGEVTLRGRVGDRRQKLQAEQVAAACPGVRKVHNRLRVARW